MLSLLACFWLSVFVLDVASPKTESEAPNAFETSRGVFPSIVDIGKDNKSPVPLIPTATRVITSIDRPITSFFICFFIAI